MNKKFFNVVATAAMVATALAPATASAATDSFPFTDVKGDNYKTGVQFLLENGITGGTSATTYSPGKDVTRGQMALFLSRALDLTDIDSSTSQAIDAVKKAGVANGYSDKDFGAADSITRAQMATMLVNAFPEIKSVEGKEVTFKDIDKAGSHKGAVLALAKAGVTVGNGKPGMFGPTEHVTRGQMALFLHRVFDQLDNYSFVDNGDNTMTVTNNTAGKFKDSSFFVQGTPLNKPTITVSKDGKEATIDFGVLDYDGLRDINVVVGASKSLPTPIALKDSVAPTLKGEPAITKGAAYTDFILTFSEPVVFADSDINVTLYDNGGYSDAIKGQGIKYPADANMPDTLVVRIQNADLVGKAFDTVYLESKNVTVKDLSDNAYLMDGGFLKLMEPITNKPDAEGAFLNFGELGFPVVDAANDHALVGVSKMKGKTVTVNDETDYVVDINEYGHIVLTGLTAEDAKNVTKLTAKGQGNYFYDNVKTLLVTTRD